MTEDETSESFDELVGGVALVGLTYLKADESLDEQVQMHGVITSAGEAGVTIELAGQRQGEIFRLPPDRSAFKPGEEAEYRLRSTGEVVINPDWVSEWTVTRGLTP